MKIRRIPISICRVVPAVARRDPHRPGRAQLTHPVLQREDSLTEALRRERGETFVGAETPQRPARWRPPLPGGPLRYSQAPSDWFACFRSLLRDHYDCRNRLPARFGFPRWRVPTRFPRFRSHRPQKARPVRPDVGEPVSSLSGDVRWPRCGSPSFPGYPHMPLPCSQLPARSCHTWPAPPTSGV